MLCRKMAFRFQKSLNDKLALRSHAQIMSLHVVYEYCLCAFRHTDNEIHFHLLVKKEIIRFKIPPQTETSRSHSCRNMLPGVLG